jgi:hypothetical protein
MIVLNTLLAACDNVIGCITPPDFIPTGTQVEQGHMPGLIAFLNSILRVVFVVAGLWALINFILAGFEYMNSQGDPKKVSAAWQKIWMTLVGLIIIVASFLLAAIVGILIFKDPFAILNPKFN